MSISIQVDHSHGMRWGFGMGATGKWLIVFFMSVLMAEKAMSGNGLLRGDNFEQELSVSSSIDGTYFWAEVPGSMTYQEYGVGRVFKPEKAHGVVKFDTHYALVYRPDTHARHSDEAWKHRLQASAIYAVSDTLDLSFGVRLHGFTPDAYGNFREYRFGLSQLLYRGANYSMTAGYMLRDRQYTGNPTVDPCCDYYKDAHIHEVQMNMNFDNGISTFIRLSSHNEQDEIATKARTLTFGVSKAF